MWLVVCYFALSYLLFLLFQRLAIELSRNHAAQPSSSSASPDRSHVSLLEQSIDNDDDSADQSVTKETRQSVKMMYNKKSKKTKTALHTAIDVEMAIGNFDCQIVDKVCPTNGNPTALTPADHCCREVEIL